MTPPGTTESRSRPTPAGGRPGLVLAVLSLAAFMASLDLFIVNVGFDAIGRDFHGESITNLSWMPSTATPLSTPPCSSRWDAWPTATGARWDSWPGSGSSPWPAWRAPSAPRCGLLVAFRVLQAVGAAALTPTSLGLLLAATAPLRRARAVRIWAATGALAAAVGPVVGGDRRYRPGRAPRRCRPSGHGRRVVRHQQLSGQPGRRRDPGLPGARVERSAAVP